MAKWREESGKTIKGAEEGSSAESDVAPAEEPGSRTEARAKARAKARTKARAKARTKAKAGPGTTAPASHARGDGRRARDGNPLRTGVRRASDIAAELVGIVATIICVLLALHIAFVVFSANGDNTIVRAVNNWADRFAWRFHDIFVPKDERVGVLVNYGLAAFVYLIAGRVAAGLIRRIR
jgi:hypothetical protein